jgi:branched-chain amino acid aminotransferase
MAFEKSEYIWMNGKLVKWDDARIHVLSHVVHYGSSVFEGMRAYESDRGPVLFRLRDHSIRLHNSAKLYRMQIPYTPDEIDQAIIDLIAVNKLKACYVRPIAYRGYESLGVDGTSCPIDLTIAVWPWGKYLGPDAIEKGVSVRFSSWNRLAPNTMPTMAKAGANYMNSQLIKMEALADGYAEGIALDIFGHVSEGSAQNIFLVADGKLLTPPFSASVLPGITRRSIMKIAEDMGIKVLEQNIAREQCYFADEVFFTGSAAEVTPISEIDHIKIGNGKCGPITRRLQDTFFAIVTGKAPDKHGWLTYVNEHAGVKV